MLWEFIVASAGLVGGIYFMLAVRKEVIEGDSSNQPLNKNEKLIILLLCFIDPIINGAIFYYGWRKRLPAKAKQANMISFGTFLVMLFIGFIYGFF